MGKILGKKTLLKHARLEVISADIEFENGNKSNYIYTKFPVTVSIVPVDANGIVYLCKEWRAAWDRYLIQIPAGICETKNEEKNPSSRARKELLEEVEMDADNIEKLATTVVSANSNGMHHIFLATGLKKAKGTPDENEIIEILKMPIKKAYSMFMDGELTTTYTILGLKLAKEKLKL